MNIYIAENIRRLRRERDLTQEKFAEHIRVSTQAVSKWERGESLPDISMVLPIAAYFGVTTDELLGFDVARDEARIQEFLHKEREAASFGGGFRQQKIIIEAYREYPNDYRIMNLYTQVLRGQWCEDSKTCTDRTEENKDEIIRLCSRVLDECTASGERFNAAYTLIRLYTDMDMREKAAELCDQFPNHYRYTKPELLQRVYEGRDDPGGEQLLQEGVMNAYGYLSHTITDTMHRITNYKSFSADSEFVTAEQFEILERLFEKQIALDNIVFEDGDTGGSMNSLFAHMFLAQRSFLTGDDGRAIAHMDKAIEHFKRIDAFFWSEETYVHTSILLNGYEVERKIGAGTTLPTQEQKQNKEAVGASQQKIIMDEWLKYRTVKNAELFDRVFEKYQ